MAILVAGCLEAAISVSLGRWYGAPSALATALGLAVVVAAGLVGGPIAIGAVAALGWGLFFWLVADGAPRAAPTVVAWLAVAGASGVLAARLRGLRQERERGLEAELRFRAVAARLPVAVYRHAVGRRERLLEIGSPVEAMLGFPVADWLGEPRLFERLLHPDDRDRVRAELMAAAGSGAPYRLEYRLFARDGRLVWVRDESVTVRDAKGERAYTLGYLVDVGGERQARERLERLDLLRRASEFVASSLDCHTILPRVAALFAREFADCCLIDLVEEDGSLRRVAVAQREPHRIAVGEALPEPEGVVARVMATGEPELGGPTASGGASPRGRASYLCVPLRARGRTLGALTLLSGAQGRAYDHDDLAFAGELALQVALAVESARLYAEAEARAEAARALSNVGDGVLLVDRVGRIRLWNAAAEAITGLTAKAVLGHAALEAIPGWRAVVERTPVSDSPQRHQAETIPIETAEGERWISISGVEFVGGVVYAFRDFTDEHRLDELKTEFLATASHELRTPLAAVYGAAQTLRAHDFALDESGRDRFLSMIIEEADRLGRIVNEILLAHQLERGQLDVGSEPFDPAELVERVAEATRTHLPPHLALETNTPLSASPRRRRPG